MVFQKIALPYPKDALTPYISEETMSYHYEKHHQAYADKLNQLIENTDFAEKNIVDIVKNSNWALYNNAAQFWNHNFFWNCLSPTHDQVPSGKLAELIDQNFGSFASFKEQFIFSAVGNFGSGWTWLESRRKIRNSEYVERSKSASLASKNPSRSRCARTCLLYWYEK